MGAQDQASIEGGEAGREAQGEGGKLLDDAPSVDGLSEKKVLARVGFPSKQSVYESA